jgi:hypothetical protein
MIVAIDTPPPSCPRFVLPDGCRMNAPRAPENLSEALVLFACGGWI